MAVSSTPDLPIEVVKTKSHTGYSDIFVVLQVHLTPINKQKITERHC